MCPIRSRHEAVATVTLLPCLFTMDVPGTSPAGRLDADAPAPSGIRSAEQMVRDLEGALARTGANTRSSRQGTDFVLKLNQVREASRDRNRLLKQSAGLFADSSGAKLVALCRWSGTDSDQTPGLFRLAGAKEGVAKETFAKLLDVSRTTIETGSLECVTQLGEGKIAIAVAIPRTRYDFLVALFGNERTATEWCSSLQIAAAQVSIWDATCDSNRLDSQLEQLAASTDLNARLKDSEDPEQAARTLVDELHANYPGLEIAFGICRGKSAAVELISTSGKLGIDERAESRILVEATLQESLTRGIPSAWPPPENDRLGLLAHRQLAERTGKTVLRSIPLTTTSGTRVGAALISGESKSDVEQAAFLLEVAAEPLAATLQLLKRTRAGRLTRFSRRLKELVYTNKGRAICAAAGMALLAMFIPISYQISTDLELQPVTRRLIAAPFAAPLEKGHVLPGDLVEVDQVLATLDGRELQWELVGLRAELEQAEKEYAGQLAGHHSGQAEIARLETKRIEQRIVLLESRIANLQIRSPLAGMVVSGDLSKTERAPIEIGTTLFEVAPLEAMRVQLQLPEMDARHVSEGAVVRFRLDAFPEQRLSGTIQRIHPRAEIIDNENVFIAELEIANLSGRLRPGMRGNARVAGGRKSIGWILFHKAVHSAQVWCGW